MEIISINKEDSFTNILDSSVYTIGNFDGVHKGHQALFKATKLIADNLNCSWGVITFEPSTKGFFYKDYKFLTTIEQKINLFNRLKVPKVIIVDFNLVYNLTCSEFISKFLLKKLNIKALVCGDNFRMGNDKVKVHKDVKAKNIYTLNYPYHISSSGYKKNDNGNAKVICISKFTYCSINNIKLSVYSVNIETLNNLDISSTNIKLLLNKGRIREANVFLGYNFTIKSKVIHGKKLGRTLGFPTINMSVPEYVSIKYGIYATKTYLSSGEIKNSVSSFGIRPTINVNDKKEILETYIFDYNDNLYNKIVSVEFFDYIRAEKKFSNIYELITAIKKDIIEAKKIIE